MPHSGKPHSEQDSNNKCSGRCMEDQSPNVMLTIPEQKLTRLSFAGPNVRDLEDWVQGLPMANIGETAKHLYHAIIELNQLAVAPLVRYQLLETVRGPIYFVCAGLAKHFLNQPVILPEKQRKIANLAQALQLHLATGYKIVVVEGQSQVLVEKVRRVIAHACHRAISDLAQTILRAYQLYCPSPSKVWLEIHQLYRFAEEHNLLRIDTEDPQARYVKLSRIDDAYKKVLLLGCSKPNQCRQNDIEVVYGTFENWTRYVEVGKPCHENDLFIINPHRDAPPVYRSLYDGPITKDFCGLDTSELAQRITDYLGQLKDTKVPPNDILPMPVRLADRLVSHLGQSFGILTKRNFKRLAANGQLFVCVGLSATHYFCGNGVDFELQLVGNGNRVDDSHENLFIRRMKQKDVWSSSVDAGIDRSTYERADLSPIAYTGISDKTDKPASERKVVYQQHQVPLVNISPGGYCLQWQGEIPINVQAGEILGIRESEEQPWSIATIRWIRQVKQQGTQIGIELLAPSATPCGVQLIQRVGENSDYLRGLLLPPLPAIGQPMTLITPRLPFQEGHRVIINQHGKETKAQLSHRSSATASYSRFVFKDLEVEPQPASKSQGNEFDSIWSIL